MALFYQLSKKTLPYIKAATTSRGSLSERILWLISVSNKQSPSITGTGECGVIPGLSPEDYPAFENLLTESITLLNEGKAIEKEVLDRHPAMAFALETAELDLQTGGQKMLFNNAYSRKESGIAINGLVWMNSIEAMRQEATSKIAQGFDCLKFKVGAQDFDSECALLYDIRKQHDAGNLLLRLDANGAFTNDDALYKLNALKRFSIHIIEQPIKPKQWDEMQEICAKSPIPIALDEELIGIHTTSEKRQLLKFIQPSCIILKPSLLGGLKASDEWIEIAQQLHIDWLATSALESNIGLNAISQWVAEKNNLLHQGLGTGQLYKTNFPPYTTIEKGLLYLS